MVDAEQSMVLDALRTRLVVASGEQAGEQPAGRVGELVGKPVDILTAPYPQAIVDVAARLSNGERLSADDARDLLKAYWRRQMGCIWFLSAEDEAGFMTAVGLTDEDLQQDVAAENLDQPYNPNQTVSELFPKGVKDTDDYDAYLQLFCEAVKGLSQDETVAIAKDVYRLITGGCFPDYFDGYDILKSLADSPHAAACLSELVDFSVVHADEYQYLGRSIYADSKAVEVDNVNDLLRSLEHLEGFLEHIPAKLAQMPEEDRNKITAVLVDALGFPQLLNLVRTAVDQEQDDVARAKLVELGKYVLGVDDDLPFHESLAGEYEMLAFEGYQPYQRTHDYELELLGRLAGEGPLVELGSGEGRILNALALAGRRNLIGVDFTQSYVERARKADATGSVEYRQADWLDTGVENASYDTVISLGRSLCHTTDLAGLKEVLRSAARMLKPGGQMIFDLPDPQRGEYHTARMRHLAHVQQLGVEGVQSGDKSLEDRVAYVVDSPNGRDFMNRFVPSAEMVKEACRLVGMEVEVVGRASISDAGAETIYFRAVKPLASEAVEASRAVLPAADPDQASATLDAIMTSLLKQSGGGE